MFNPNPLNIHNLRELKHSPPHFTKVIFDSDAPRAVIQAWVSQNLVGRFFYGEVDIPNPIKGFDRQSLVSFEIASEGSYFSLMLTHIK